jgi:hypothetical protein
LDARSTPPISPARTDIPESGSLTAAATALIRDGAQTYLFLGVSLFAMAFVALAAFLGSAAPQVADSAPKARASAANAETVHVITRPANVEQDEQLPPPVKHSGYREMSLRDFMLDEGRLIGRKIRVTGLYQQMEDIALLAASGDDMNPIDLDITRLSRKERSVLLDCPNRDCRFQVEGRVRKNRSGVIVRADDVQEVQEN